MQKLSQFPKNAFTVKILDSFVQVKKSSRTQGKKDLHNVFIVMDLYANDLQTILSDTKMEISEEQATTLIFNTCLAVKYLHSANIMHRDLRAVNLLVTSDCRVKICDFGMSRSIEFQETSLQDTCKSNQ